MTADPLCWYWPPQLPSRGLAQERFEARMERNGCTREEIRILWAMECAADAYISDGAVTLAAWQDGRCAICGKVRDLVCDHDHQTGLVRGWLCQSCNAGEGTHHEGDTIFERYRQRPPAAILGITVRYLNPVTGREAGPALEVLDADRWVDAASDDIGL
ncbi:endonuclease domain-containing protein [Streptomyces sp. XY533]|uniref:endonuclease domain-containing protein n=1 Tax=Streptomyces sp. XY533 TaxID=1519481 RepID=UPI000ACAC873|nr:endonuclease domain-containing protein [Streptomyces sp. XY533]